MLIYAPVARCPTDRQTVTVCLKPTFYECLISIYLVAIIKCLLLQNYFLNVKNVYNSIKTIFVTLIYSHYVFEYIIYHIIKY